MEDSTLAFITDFCPNQYFDDIWDLCILYRQLYLDKKLSLRPNCVNIHISMINDLRKVIDKLILLAGGGSFSLMPDYTYINYKYKGEHRTLIINNTPGKVKGERI